MKDFDTMAGHERDTCPVHGAAEKAEYQFGLHDATVIKWRCGCCACWIGDALDDEGTYHTSYSAAAGRARLGVARAALPLA